MNEIIDNGVWPVMITPYTENNAIDYDGVLELLEWYADQKVAGVFAVCQSSEMFCLSGKERIGLIKFLLANRNSGMGIIASGHVSDSPEEQIREANEVIDAGVDSYVFLSNRFAAEGEKDDTVKRSIDALLSHLPEMGFGIYECPHPYKRLLSPELLKWCAGTNRFTFLKDTCCNIYELKAKIKAVEGSPLKVFNANTATLLESLKMGASGYSGVMSNFHADLYAWLCRNFDKEPEKASVVQDFLGLTSLVENQMYPVNAKYHMQLEGVNINLFSRMQDFTAFSSNRQMEIEQLRRAVGRFREHFLRGN